MGAAKKRSAASGKRRAPRAAGTFGELVRRVREAQGLSLEAMGAQVGMSRGALCDVEKGRRTVSAALAARWAEALGYEAPAFVALALQAQLDAAGLKMRASVR